jgi:hypothetical protein
LLRPGEACQSLRLQAGQQHFLVLGKNEINKARQVVGGREDRAQDGARRLEARLRIAVAVHAERIDLSLPP